MKCYKCGNELTTGDAPNSAMCRRCESISSSPASDGSPYYPLFKYMYDNHGLILLDSELADIMDVAVDLHRKFMFEANNQLQNHE